MKGKIVLIPFPYTDLSGSKRRPALVLLQAEKDVVVAYISSRMTIPNEACVPISESHADFRESGLKTSSVIRLDKVATISSDLVIGEIGEVGPIIKQEINERLSRIYRL